MYDFGLTPAQFFDLTFAKFAALSKLHSSRILHEEHGPALITWYIASLFHDKKKGPKPRIEDFMPNGSSIEIEPISPEALRAKLEQAFPRKGPRKETLTEDRG